MQSRLATLERDVRWLKTYACVSTAVLLVFGLAAFLPQEGTEGILRARGLVIEDEAGRERILLGAPIPAAANRVRTDMDRVRAAWAHRYPDPEQYLHYYEGYNHSMTGLLVLDEAGFDRLAIGDPVPDPNIGKRIGPASGITLNDQEGFERSGYGLIKLGDDYRIVLGLDSDKGEEGLVLLLDDAGRIGLILRDGDRSAYLGSAPPGAITGMSEPLFGLVLKQGDEVLETLNIAPSR